MKGSKQQHHHHTDKSEDNKNHWTGDRPYVLRVIIVIVHAIDLGQTSDNVGLDPALVRAPTDSEVTRISPRVAPRVLHKPVVHRVFGAPAQDLYSMASHKGRRLIIDVDGPTREIEQVLVHVQRRLHRTILLDVALDVRHSTGERVGGGGLKLRVVVAAAGARSRAAGFRATSVATLVRDAHIWNHSIRNEILPRQVQVTAIAPRITG